MLALYEKFRKAISHKIDPLAENRPAIAWIKWVQDNSATSFLCSQPNPNHRTIAKMAEHGNFILVKTNDGNFYRKHPAAQQWSGPINGIHKTFNSFYLDNILAQARTNGLKPQPSAMDIFNTLMGVHGKRYHIICHGTDAQLASIDTDYPAPPRAFTQIGDYVAPEDLAPAYPAFAAYLKRTGLSPFRPGHGYKPQP